MAIPLPTRRGQGLLTRPSNLPSGARTTRSGGGYPHRKKVGAIHRLESSLKFRAEGRGGALN